MDKQTVERQLTIADLSGKGFQCLLCSNNSTTWEEMKRHVKTDHKDVYDKFIKP